jgi:putrescine aminotransferase
MTLAKGITSGYIPLGAVMFNDRISKVLSEKGGELAHGYTYSGHPVCTAVALENIRILQEERMIENIQTDTGPYLAQRWAELGEHPIVGEARVVGMVGALELVPRKPSREYFADRGAVGQMCRDFALRNGLILRATNDAMLLSPPLIITREQIDEMFEKAWKSLDQTAAALGIGKAAA